MNQRIGTFLLLTGLFLGFNSYSRNLCQNDEQVLFSCETVKSKNISICSSPDLSAQKGYMQYRFGTPVSKELEYPKDFTMPAAKSFQGRAQMFSGGGGIYLRFAKKNYEYILYDGQGKNWLMRGVIVLKNSKLIAYMPCTSDIVTEISPQLLERLKIPLDADNQEFFPGEISANNPNASNSMGTSNSSDQLADIQHCYSIANTTLDLHRCSDKEHAFYDSLLNNTYQTLLTLVTGELTNLVIEAQKSWLGFREKECKLISMQNDGGTLQSLSLEGCYTTFNKKRILQLQDFIKYYRAVPLK